MEVKKNQINDEREDTTYYRVLPKFPIVVVG